MPVIAQIHRPAERSLQCSGKELAVLERVARNLPAPKMAFRRVETKVGTVYMAYGQGRDLKWHGVWGHRGVARTFEGWEGLTEPQVQEMLLEDALWWVREANARGVHQQGFWQ